MPYQDPKLSLLEADGSIPLTGNWDIGDGFMIQADKIRARDGDGLKLFESTDASGIIVGALGLVGLNTLTPRRRLDVLGTTVAQLRVTHTDNSIYTDFFTSATGNLVISPTGYIVLSSSKANTGDPTGVEGMIYINTQDNAVRMYADGAWRTLASW